MRRDIEGVMKKYSMNGFTLIEVLIAVIIIGVIAGIAYPNYMKFITESRRSDATVNLVRIANLQERFFLECNPVKYAAAFGGAANSCAATGTLANTGLGATGNTPDGHYNITVAPCAGGALTSCFVLTATPIGVQATNDGAKCGGFTITNTGIKGVTSGTEGASCWKK
jgi:type IV pilus assembly protein PilE